MKALRLVFLILALAAPVLAANALTFEEMEEGLTCQCGCGLTVHSCNHLGCPSAEPLRAEIREQMALGKSKEQILAYFEDKYGEKILSSPTTSGFNLTAWITPFALLALAAITVTMAAARWGRRPPPPSAPESKPPTPSEYQKILERELEHFDK